MNFVRVFGIETIDGKRSDKIIEFVLNEWGLEHNLSRICNTKGEKNGSD